MTNIDFEYEAQKDFVYLHEEREAFFNSINEEDCAKIDVLFLSEVNHLQRTAEKNECIPASIVVKGENTLETNYERQIKSVSFQRTS